MSLSYVAFLGGGGGYSNQENPAVWESQFRVYPTGPLSSQMSQACKVSQHKWSLKPGTQTARASQTGPNLTQRAIRRTPVNLSNEPQSLNGLGPQP